MARVKVKLVKEQTKKHSVRYVPVQGEYDDVVDAVYFKKGGLVRMSGSQGVYPDTILVELSPNQ